MCAQKAVACHCMQPFPNRNAEVREEKGADAKRERGFRNLKGKKQRIGRRKAEEQ